MEITKIEIRCDCGRIYEISNLRCNFACRCGRRISIRNGKVISRNMNRVMIYTTKGIGISGLPAGVKERN